MGRLSFIGVAAPREYAATASPGSMATNQGAFLSLEGPQNPFQRTTLGTVYLITVDTQDVIYLQCLL